jgi:dihydrofolate reductase
VGKGVTLVAARDRVGAIGRGNALPWHLPDDLKRFKALTLGHAVLMGRKTAESIGRALPGRLNLVMSRRADAPFAGQAVVDSIDAALSRIGDGDTLMVIGGGEIYRASIDRADTLELTDVDTRVADADVFFPPVDENRWRESFEQWHAADDRHAHAFRFRTLRRIVAD